MNRLTWLIAATLFTPALGQTTQKPNIVVILADDMGSDSVAAFNAKSKIATPHINRLVSEGMSLRDAHSGSSVCSPTRYGLLTGRYAWRTRLKSGIVNKWQGPLIEADRLTLGSMLQDEGYVTRCIGKWHLGWDWRNAEGDVTTKLGSIDFTKPMGGGPTTRGFDGYFGDDVPNWPPFAWIEDDRLTAVPTETMPEDDANGVRVGPRVKGWQLDAVLPTITRRCVEFITGRAKEPKPFFLYFAMTSPHTPINPSPEFLGKSEISAYADFLMETDWSVGQVLRALDDADLAKNTLVIFTADNGTSPRCDFEGLEAKNVRLREHWRGHKGDIWEGGHRVPFVVRWPGQIAKASEAAAPVSLVDIMA
ncbi:MAG: arylsulfatase, partial [Planctomycetes bacterium]|nr:arylsulfatase [Planctomycetota bacterium]